MWQYIIINIWLVLILSRARNRCIYRYKQTLFFLNLIFSKKGNISGKIGFRGESIYIKCRHSIYIASMSTRRGIEFISAFPLQFNKKWLRWCLYALSKTYLNVLYSKLYENMRCKNRVDFRSMYVFSLKKSSRISIHRWIQL